MSDTAHQANPSMDTTTEKFSLNRTPPTSDRGFAAVYLTTVGVAMIGWLYVISRAALAVISWMIFS